MHAIPIKPNVSGWEFNGSFESPTFSPSVLITGVESITDEEAERILAGEPFEPKPRRCHFFIKEGKIQYLNDCSHSLAGKTVPMQSATMLENDLSGKSK